MSASFVNYHVRSEDAQAVAAMAGDLVQGRAYVSSPPVNGWVTVYDQASEGQDAYEIGRLAGDLSAGLGTAVFAFVVGSDELFVYYLFDRGDLMDEYNSAPAPPAPGTGVDPSVWFAGRPDLLVTYCPPGTPVAPLTAALARGDVLREPGFASALRAEQRLRPLVAALRIDPARAGCGFHDLDGRPPALPDGAQFLRLDGRLRRSRSRGPVPPRLPPRPR